MNKNEDNNVNKAVNNNVNRAANNNANKAESSEMNFGSKIAITGGSMTNKGSAETDVTHGARGLFNIKVSATSANIGAGFDCMGLALDLFNELEFSANFDQKLKIITDSNLPSDSTNLVYQSMTKVFDLVGKYPNVYMKQTNNIPVASGLGSSAACVVAGVIAANIMTGGHLGEQDLVNLCSSIDGHPDNVIPCLMGGITAGVMVDKNNFANCHVEYIKCNASISLKLAVATPDFPLKTSFSRSVLPNQYAREDVVFSLSRAVLTFAALINGDFDKLRVLDDKIHTPYRIPLIKGYHEVTEIMDNNGALSHFISGAGPSIIGFFTEKQAFELPIGWSLRWLNIVNSGYRLTTL